METDLKQYIGIEIIEAAEMSHHDFLYHRAKQENKTINLMTEDIPGYMILKENGEEYWDHEVEFEKKFKKANGMNFGLAVEAMKKGFKISRKGWDKNIKYLTYSKIHHSSGIKPTILIKKKPENLNDASLVSWKPNQDDILACDWVMSQ